jgi:hypothetical protein
VTAQVSGDTVLVFVGIPLLIIAVVGLLVFAGSIASGPRYRPGLSWWAPPVWIGGPRAADGEPVDAPELEPGPTGRVAQTTGGASASW